MILTAIALVLLAMTTGAGAEPPYGADDFYPSSERPFGWRGDGTAAWPGATPVTEWREGTPKGGRVRDLKDPERTHSGWVLADRRKKNIAWKTRMPCYANSQPIVAGDRVICTAEPYYLVCADVNTGRILWVRENNPFDFRGKSEQEADALTTFMEQLYVMGGLFRKIVGGYTRHPNKATAGALPMWHRHARWTEHLLLKMNRGPYAVAVQEALHAIDDQLREIMALNAGDRSAHIEGPQCKAVSLPAVWMNKTHDILPYAMWDGWIGRTFAAPETDGEFVYTSMGQGQVACYDLAGARVWARNLTIKQGGEPTTAGTTLGGNNCSHPRLVENVLCVYATTGPKDCDALYGLDKRTGDVLWSTADPRTYQGVARGSGWLRIPRSNGTILQALASNRGAVIRVTDGTILGSHGLRYNHGPDEQGHSDIVVGNRWFVNESSSIVAFELAATNDDKVTFKELWKAPVRQYCRSPILHNGYFYRLGKGNEIIKSADGSTMVADARKGSMFTVKVSYPSPIIAGTYLVGYAAGGRRVPFTTMAQTLKIGDNGMPQMTAAQNIMDGDPIPSMPRYEKHLPGYRPGDVWSNAGATPTQFGYACMAANANRLFLRSVSHLYCIGDPNVPYSWDPASRPKRITEKLDAAAMALAKRDPVDALSSPYAWDRRQGREVLVKMSPSEQQARLDRVAALTCGKGWRTLRAAAATLRDLGKAAAPALPALQAALQAWVEANDASRAMELLRTLLAIDPAAGKAIVPLLDKAVDSGDPRAVRLACRLGAELNADAEPMVPGLIRVLGSGDDASAWESALALHGTGVGNPRTVSALAGALTRSNRWTVIAALDALAARGEAAGPAATDVAGCLERDDQRIVLHAVRALAAMGTSAQGASPALRKTLTHESIRCATAAAETLHVVDPGGEKKLASELVKNLSSKDDTVVQNNARALSTIGPKFSTRSCRIDAVDGLADVLRTRTPRLRREAASSLGKFGSDGKFAVGDLREAAMGPHCPEQAKEALAKIVPGMKVEKIEPEIGDDLGLGL